MVCGSTGWQEQGIGLLVHNTIQLNKEETHIDILYHDQVKQRLFRSITHNNISLHNPHVEAIHSLQAYAGTSLASVLL